MKKISNKTHVLKMSSKNKPVESIDSGEMVSFETFDCFSNTLKTEEDLFSSVGWDKVNPATGPLYINEAKQGDILKVEIIDIKIDSKGVMAIAPGFGVLGDIFNEEKTKIIPIENNKAIFNKKLSFEIRPMIGVIGTAPKSEDIPTGTPEAHGGNMDCKRIVKGSTLYLPVNVDGGLLALGDLHAIMGDGEISVSGVEIAGEVIVKVSIIKGKHLPLPLLIEGREVMTIASALTLDEASNQATRNMHKFLVQELSLDKHEATMLLSVAGNLKICQVVDPLKTARMEIPLDILDKYNYRI
ncbi:acetamidase/formamidase family protein [Clostridium sp. D2Q-11]|uniref:Acetamidase/formamidase family protein n=1 Tax=Anaeromonas frigoriresistens TaxID=2683708 RepID=A0A942Z6D6_9FIRM|nr:acetamidase/formamidase family protein [Anaeromonas frigoriresistens]MBS4537472.1 acetamidase/formamidase family protein [Anaeromonas frigoriresistens]